MAYAAQPSDDTYDALDFAVTQVLDAAVDGQFATQTFDARAYWELMDQETIDESAEKVDLAETSPATEKLYTMPFISVGT